MLRYTVVNYHRRAFTLIELSIVLVVIGLIVGGVLAGQELIRAATIRATISQIEKYNTAVNTFRVKYENLPGDIPSIPATKFGLAARGLYEGQGDGNGRIDGAWANAPGSNYGVGQGMGETAMFWVDLSTAHLIDGTFSTATSTTVPPLITGTSRSAYLPQAKLANNYVYVWNPEGTPLNNTLTSSHNYFGISAVSSISSSCTACMLSSASLAVSEAYNIDKKTDDGFPLTGKVLGIYVNQTNSAINLWAGTANSSTAVAGSSTTCYDNNNNIANPVVYSLQTNDGRNIACGISLQLQ